MSRVFKFRIWDKANKEYMILGATGLDARNGDVIDYYNEGNRLGGPEEYDVEQHTGSKDKNGKEIYEGDIVKARWYRAKHARLDTKGEVKFNDGWFYIHDDPDGQDRLGVPVHNCYDIEVIGNVHEDKELLDDAQST